MKSDPEKEKLQKDLAKAKEIIKWLLIPAANLERRVREYGRQKARRFLDG